MFAALDQVSYPFSLRNYILLFFSKSLDWTGNFWRLAVIASISTNAAIASHQIFHRFGLPDRIAWAWWLLKYVEEAEFGPDTGVNTTFLIGSLVSKLDALSGQMINHRVLCVGESCKWMTKDKESALVLLSEAKLGSDHIGQYILDLWIPDCKQHGCPSFALPGIYGFASFSSFIEKMVPHS